MPAGAGDRYVATTGDDTANDCTQEVSPCLTVEYAIGQANPGDTIYIAAGTYTENELQLVDTTLTIIGDGSGSTFIQAATTRGTAADRVMSIDDNSDLTLQGSRFVTATAASVAASMLRAPATSLRAP